MKNKIINTIWYITFILMMAYQMFYRYAPVKDALKQFNPYCLAVLGIIVIFKVKNYDAKSLLGMSIIGLFILWNFNIVHSVVSIQVYLLAVSFCDIDFKEFVWVEFIFMTLFFIIVMYLCLSGEISDYIIYRGDVARHSFGFQHPNGFGGYIVAMCCSYIFLRYKTLRAWDLLVPSISAYLVYYFADSRTAYISLILFVLGLILIKVFKDKDPKFIRVLIPFTPIVCCLAIYILVLNYGKYDFINTINTILSRRVSYGYQFYSAYGVHLLGGSISAVQKQGGILDSAYLYIMIRYGLLVLAGFLATGYFSLRYLLTDQSYLMPVMVLIMVIYFIYGVTETTMFQFWFNPYLMYFGTFAAKKSLGHTDYQEDLVD